MVVGGKGVPVGGTWTSGLSAAGFACLRTAGFEPVGQVMGASVHSFDPRAVVRAQRRVDSERRYAGHTVIRDARRAAMRRLEAECAALGGDGIIGVRVEIEPFHGEERALAFRVNGTAVRARGGVRPPRPFSSDLSAREFTELIDAGWVPVELVLGVSLGALSQRVLARGEAQSATSAQEMAQWSPEVTFLRRAAREMLTDEADGADGVVISDAGLRVWEFQGQHFAEARFLGTAIAAFRAVPSTATRTIVGRRLRS